MRSKIIKSVLALAVLAALNIGVASAACLNSYGPAVSTYQQSYPNGWKHVQAWTWG